MKQQCNHARSSLVIAAVFMLLVPFVVGAQGAKKTMADQADGLYAQFDTTKGEILVSLEFQKTPLTVINFTGLAEGKLKNNAREGKPFYDGLTFHRVIADFMIQGGDPEGSGRGGPGYRFADEFDPSLRFTGPGILAMANAGPGTNGSQFFITHTATPHLNDKHTIFGHVVSGQDVVNKIAQGDKINKLTIIRKGAAAQAFKNDQPAFDAATKAAVEHANKALAAGRKSVIDSIAKVLPNAKQSSDGIFYLIKKEGTGPKPKRGQMVSVHYTGKFLDGKVFDSSVSRNEPFSFAVGTGGVIPGWDDSVLDMKVGEKRSIVLPPELAYGPNGIPGAIPPNSFLYFDIEFLSVK